MQCAAHQRVGRLKGKPCPLTASTVIDGVPYCGNHARLKPDVRRGEPAHGYAAGHKVKVSVGFDRETFDRVRSMAVDEGASFSATARTLVRYAVDEIDLQCGRNDLASDREDVTNG